MSKGIDNHNFIIYIHNIEERFPAMGLQFSALHQGRNSPGKASYHTETSPGSQ